MGPQLNVITIAGAVLLAAAIAGIVAWYVLRNRISRVRGEGRAETAHENQRASLMGSELERERERVRDQEIRDAAERKIVIVIAVLAVAKYSLQRILTYGYPPKHARANHFDIDFFRAHVRCNREFFGPEHATSVICWPVGLNP